MALLVLVATSVSMTNIISLDENDIFPHIAQFWRSHPPSETFERHAYSLICTLEERRMQGELVNGKTPSVGLFENNDTDSDREALRSSTFRKPKNLPSQMMTRLCKSTPQRSPRRIPQTTLFVGHLSWTLAPMCMSATIAAAFRT